MSGEVVKADIAVVATVNVDNTDGQHAAHEACVHRQYGGQTDG